MNVLEEAANAIKAADQFDGMAHNTTTSTGLKLALEDAARKARDYAAALARLKPQLPPPPKPKQ